MTEHVDPDGTITTYIYDARGLLVTTTRTTPGDGNELGPCAGLTPTIIGTHGDDVIHGTSGNDVIIAMHGNNTIHAGSGDDIICTGTGNDVIDGGSGNDIIWSQGGNNIITGGSGHDTIQTGTGNDTIDAGSGNDIVYTAGGTNTINGGSGNDTIHAADGTNTINGGSGNDIIWAGSTNSEIHGGSGNDTCQPVTIRTGCQTDLTEPPPSPPANNPPHTVTETRTYNGDGTLTSIVTNTPEDTITNELVWDPTIAIPQIVTRNDVNLVYGAQRELVDGEPTMFNAFGDQLGGHDAWAPFGPATPGEVGFGYRGEFETLTGVHLRARHLDPTLGAFTTHDPLPGVTGTTVIANSYHYANNDPINLTDPLGLRPDDFSLIINHLDYGVHLPHLEFREPWVVTPNSLNPFIAETTPCTSQVPYGDGTGRFECIVEWPDGRTLAVNSEGIVNHNATNYMFPYHTGCEVRGDCTPAPVLDWLWQHRRGILQTGGPIAIIGVCAATAGVGCLATTVVVGTTTVAQSYHDNWHTCRPKVFIDVGLVTVPYGLGQAYGNTIGKYVPYSDRVLNALLTQVASGFGAIPVDGC